MSLNIGFVGAGNVAWHLAPALDNVGIIVRRIASRSGKSGKSLVRKLYQAEYHEGLDFSAEELDVIFLTVPDDVLPEVAAFIQVPAETIVVHTSGAQSIDVLQNHFFRCGVFYPLQTLSKNKQVDFSKVPFLIEGSEKSVASFLNNLALKLTANARIVNSQERAYVHLAAVFACNFSNHMISVSERLLNKKKLNLELLLPLISETINKAIEIGPSLAQTGPARRHDLKTLDKHMSMLNDEEELAEIYRIVSQNILDQYT